MEYGEEVEENLNQQIAREMESVTLDLSGSDMLEALADAMTFQRKLTSATEDVMNEILERCH